MSKFLRDMLLFSLQNELLCNSSNAPSGFFGEMQVLAYNETFDNVAIVKILLNPNINPEIICHRVPTRCQRTMAFIVNLDALSDQSDITVFILMVLEESCMSTRMSMKSVFTLNLSQVQKIR